MDKTIGFVVLLLIGLSSCVIQGLTNDFGKLDESEKAKILPFEGFSAAKPGYIFEINAKDLREELKQHEKSMVYFFSNGCSATGCKPLADYIHYANQHDYRLFLVMNGYANLSSTLDQNVDAPLFAIDTDYYNTPISYKYTRYFENELMSLPIKTKQDNYRGNIYLFEGDQLINIWLSLPEE